MGVFCAIIGLLISVTTFVTPPGIEGKNSFAIIIDNELFDKINNEIEDYKKLVEDDGLPTYIIAGDWDNPLVLRDLITEYYKDKALEGFVLVGNIPIVLVRDAQHLTSAFKMDQDRYPPIRSSVPSDRFYDDLDLKFNYLFRDTTDLKIHYVSLDYQSPSFIEKDMYSARILFADIESYKNYFEKLKRVRSKREEVDRLVTAWARGYVSGSNTAQEDELLAMREKMGFDKFRNGLITNLFYKSNPELAELILWTVSKPKNDIFIFHGHGKKDCILVESYKDTLDTTNIVDISIEHLDKIGTELVILDACFTGAFHNIPIFAGEVLKCDGDAVVVRANSVNVMQDIWATEDIGLLKYGVSVGRWHKTHSYLESHLFGDPTFSFNASDTIEFMPPYDGYDYDEKFIPDLKKLALEHPDPAIRAQALKGLHRLVGEDITEFLYEVYENDPSFEVRMQSVILMARDRTEIFYNSLPVFIKDPYELIRRTAVKWMGEGGRESYIDYLKECILNETSERVIFNAVTSLSRIGGKKAESTLLDVYPVIKSNIDDFMVLHQAGTSISHSKKEWIEKEIISYLKSDELKKKKTTVRSMRVQRFLRALPTLIDVVEDKRENPEIRVMAAEALGWYGMYEKRGRIINALDRVINDPHAPQDLKNNAIVSKKRLINEPNKSNTP